MKPKYIDYSSVKPIGIPSNISILRFQPQSAYGNISVNDVIRFQINSPGFWDPYSAYLNIEIDCTGMDANVFQQIDGSAHSFINELIIYSQGTEIERIQEYDGVANMLSDMAFNSDQRRSRRHEGYGGNNTNLVENWRTKRDAVDMSGTGPVLTQMGAHPFQANYVDNPCGLSDINPIYLNTNLLLTSALATPNDMYTFGNMPMYQKLNYAHANSVAIGGNTALRNYFAIERADQVISDVNNLSIQEGYSATPISSANTSHPHNCGYKSLFSPDFSNGNFEPRFSSTYLQETTADGKIGQKKQILTGAFSVPLISGLLGILMPKESYKYIPMAGLSDLILEFRMNKAALFTSGYTNEAWGTSGVYSNDTPFEKIPTTMATRTWKLTKFELVADIIQFDRDVEEAIKAQLATENGIVLHSASWYLGPQYQINSTSAANGTWQINLGFESLKSVIFYYLLDDWKTYSFCRKHFRVSRDLTWLQLKVGIKYFPTLPIEGNAGDSKKWENNTANNEFLISMYKAFNKHHDADLEAQITAENFAVNERPYDVKDTRQYFLSGSGILNTNTACGLPGFYENQVVGKAIYGVNLETLNNDWTQISGINTIVNKPFELTLRCDPSNVNPALDRSATMYVFCHYDFLVQITNTGIRVLGRG